MASIARTAYPRFKQKLTDEELEKLYRPNGAELKFVRRYARGYRQQLTLVALLKAHQNLGYIVHTKNIPKQIQQYLSDWLGLSGDIALLKETSANKKSFYRYRQSIREFLGVRFWSNGGMDIAKQIIEKAAYTMSDPADLINVAIEALLQHRYGLPAFSTLDRLAGHIRQQVHERLYQQITSGLSDEQGRILYGLLHLRDGEKLSGFSRIKQAPGKATLKQMNLWSRRLDWLCSIIEPEVFIDNIAHTKIRQFAAEAAALETGDMKDIHNTPKRYTLLLCFIHQAQVQTRDELVTMFLKRMKRTHTFSKEKLKSLQEQSQELEEQMMAAFSQVVSKAANEQSNAQFGKQVRTILDDYGGVEKLMAQYKQVSAYHNKNHLPLLWKSHRQHRAAIYRILNLLDIQTATQDKELLRALQFIKENQHSRRDYLAKDIDFEFASQRWKLFVQCQHEGQIVLKRRELELCILTYIANALRCGDLYVNGSEEFSDYRQQLLPWKECHKRLAVFCDSLQLPQNADEFVAHLQQKLAMAAEKTDQSFPENTELTIDADGKAHLKRIKADPAPGDLDKFKEDVRQRMPEQHLLVMLKNVQHWVNYTRHFTPPSSSDRKLSDAVSRYLFTVFGYGCNLGAAQTARHAQEDITLRILKRINDQHITTEKIEAALNDVINEFTRFDLPFLWGGGQAAIADGTHVELIENNLIGEQHIRYGAYGGIAYHHISDTYIALFSHFIACGVWEAVYILDGLLKNISELQPDTLYADTQGQSEPVFGLAYLLGIKLMPRMRTWNDVAFYRSYEDITYKHIDSFFTQTTNWKLIKTHWKDFMQVVLSIQAGKVLPSMLLKKLGVYSRKNKLYLAFRELGRVVRTIFLLEYCSNKPMRKEIGAATTKIESFHTFRDWISFGGHVITTGDPVEQEKRIKYMNLVANIVMLHNVVDLTKVLNEMVNEGHEVTPECVQHLSPYMTEHIKRFGQYVLDMNMTPGP
ncbi:MAG: Tn3 family transposase, partial [Desulfosarcina sp.]|nr:Tn3 family transposase [Desulfobacterales bacterium]